MKCPDCGAPVELSEDECSDCGYLLHRLCPPPCDTSYHAGHGKCPACGRPAVEGPAERSSSPPLPDAAGGRRKHPCPGCGRPTWEGAETCDRCGNSLRILCRCGAIFLASELPACPTCGTLAAIERRSRRGGRRWIAAVIALLLLGAGVGTFLFLRQGGPDPQALFKEGRALREAGDPAAAEKFLRRVVELRPRFAWARYELAVALADQGRVEDAERELRQTIEIDPNRDDALLLLGQILEGRGAFAAAAELYRRAIEDYRKPRDAYRLLALLGERRRDLQMVLEAYEGESRVAIDSPELMLRLAEARMSQYRLERDPALMPAVADALRTAVDRADARIRERSTPRMHLYRAQALVRLELWGLAKGGLGSAETSRRAAAEGPERDLLDAEILWASARSTEALGNHDEAKQLRARAQQHFESTVMARESPVDALRVISLLEILDIREPIPRLLAALRARWPEAPELFEAQARFLLRSGRLTDAIALLEQLREDGRETEESTTILLVARMMERDWAAAIAEAQSLRALGVVRADISALEIKARCERALVNREQHGDEIEIVGKLLRDLPSTEESTDPNYLGAWGRYFLLAGLLDTSGGGRSEMRKGLEALSECYRRNPGDYGSALWLAWVQMALARPDNGLLDAAQTTLTRLLIAAPDLVPAARMLAEVCARNGLFERSAGLARKVLEVDPSDLVMRKLLARVSVGLEDEETALLELERVRKADDRDVECLLWLSQLYLRRGDQGFAAERFEEAKAAAAADGEVALDVIESIAAIYRSVGQPEQALRTLEDALAERPDSDSCRLAYVDLLLSLGRHEVALARLRKMLLEDPSSILVRRRICEIHLHRKEDPPELSRIISDLRARDPDLPDVALLEGSRHLLLADAAMLRGDREAMLPDARAALEKLERYVEIRPGDRNGHYSLGITRFLLDDPDGAAAALQRAQETGAGGAVMAVALLRVHGERAKRLLREGRTREAVDLLGGLVRTYPAAVDEKKSLAWALRRMGEVGASRKALEEILRRNDRDAEAWALLGGLHEGDGRLGDAAAAYGRVVEIDGENVLWRYFFASVLARLGEQDRALAELAVAARLDPRSEAVRILQVETLVAAGRSEEAWILAGNYVSEHPRDPLGYDLKGRVLQGRSDLDGAVEAFQTAYELNPERASSLWLLVKIEADHRNEITKALRLARDAVEKHPENADLMFVLGYAQVLADQVQDAAETFARVLELDPGQAAARIHLVRLEFQIGRLERAQRFLEPILIEAPWRPEIAMLAALLQDRLDAPDLAEKYYRMILAVAPEHVDALNNLAWLLAKFGQPRAEELAKRALAVQPEEPDIVDTYGFVLQQRGKVEEARRAYEKARTLYQQRIQDLEVKSRDWSHGEHVRKKFAMLAQGARSSLGQVEARLAALGVRPK